MSTFDPSTTFEAWITRLRLSWLGAKGKAIMGGFAAALGDKGIDWARQVILEHMPEFAGDESVALIASERQIEAGPHEASTDLATRLIYAVPTSQLYGRPLGMLLALYYAEFPGAVIVQQNGRAFSLSGTPDLANPAASLVVTTTAALDVALHSTVDLSRSIPVGTPWWAFDSNTDFCSRFAVLFPGPTFPRSFTTWGVATFSSSDTASVTWNNPFADTTYVIEVSPATVTDGSGPVTVAADMTTQTTTGVNVVASGAFTGTVDVLAYQAGANPFADPHPDDLRRLQRVISKWRAAKATCVGVYVAAQGKDFGWPVRTFGSGGTFGSSTVMSLTGPWS